jgi:hypothetical protein
VASEVDPAHRLLTQGRESGHGDPAELLGLARLELGGRHVARSPRRVLRLVVVDLARRDDLDRRKRLALEHGHGELPARHEGLAQDVLVVPEGEIERRRKLPGRADDREADGRTATGRLDDQRKAECVDHLLRRGVAWRPCGRWHAGPREQLLRHPLVERERAAEHARASVRDSGHVERRLDVAVLSVAAVQREEHHVGLAEGRQLGKGCAQRPPAHVPELLEGRRLTADFAPQVAGFLDGRDRAVCRVDGYDLVPAAAQSLDDGPPRSQRYASLLARATQQDGDRQAPAHRNPFSSIHESLYSFDR